MVVFVSCQAKQGHELSVTFVWLSTEGPNIFLLVQCCADIWLMQRDSGGSKAGLSLCQAQGFRTGDPPGTSGLAGNANSASSSVDENLGAVDVRCENDDPSRAKKLAIKQSLAQETSEQLNAVTDESYASRAARTGGEQKQNVGATIRSSENKLPGRPCTAFFMPSTATSASSVFDALDRRQGGGGDRLHRRQGGKFRSRLERLF